MTLVLEFSSKHVAKQYACNKGTNVFSAPTETLVQRTNDANKVGQAFF